MFAALLNKTFPYYNHIPCIMYSLNLVVIYTITCIIIFEY